MRFEFTPETPFLKQSIWFDDIFPYDEITCIVMHFLFGLEIDDNSRSMTTHMPHITRFLYFIRGAFLLVHAIFFPLMILSRMQAVHFCANITLL